MRITGKGSGIILISEANIRFLIPNQNMCVCLLKNYERRIRRQNSKSRQRMPCLSSFSRNHRTNMSLRLRLRQQRRDIPLFRICNSRRAFNSLLFLYWHVLKKDFGDHKDIPHYFDNLSNHKFAIGSHVVRHARSFLSGIHFFCILDSRLMAGMTNLKCIFLCNV